MRTTSYIFIKEPTGEFTGTTVGRGALCYTGRVLLEQFKNKERIERLIKSGPIDIIGDFEDECEGITNPAIIRKADDEQLSRIPTRFKNGPTTFSNFKELRETLASHNHFGAVSFFVYDNNRWFHSEHNLLKMKELNISTIHFDDEENG